MCREISLNVVTETSKIPMKKQDLKILIYSALISMNTVVWYEIFGDEFLYVAVGIILYVVFCIND